MSFIHLLLNMYTLFYGSAVHSVARVIMFLCCLFMYVCAHECIGMSTTPGHVGNLLEFYRCSWNI